MSARSKGWPPFHARGEGTFRCGGIGGPRATIPFVVEAWASAGRDAYGNSCSVLVNRTPITGTVSLSRWQRDLTLNGCGLSSTLRAAPGRSGIDLRLNIITPYMPITSDGKAPNLSCCSQVIREVAGKAVRRALRAEPPEPRTSAARRRWCSPISTRAIAKASGDGAYRFSPRQVFYVIRPLVREAVGAELQWGNFETIIGDYELEQGEIAGMYRDPRGTLYHPHRRDSIPLGTLQVERYQRPEWTFNKILFIEKEGFFEALKEAAWPERHDCALLTSKGQPTRAARDLLDLLGDTGEEILFFAVHDADAAGTLIYQSLQEATRARPGRKVRVINLGLEPEEALAMELEIEDVEVGERRKPIASYVPADWQDWLRYHRVELNAMTTPQFIAWLDDKMAAFGNGKLVPPGGGAHERPERYARGPAAPADHRADPARGQDRGEGRGGAPGRSTCPCRRTCVPWSSMLSPASLRLVACRHRAGRGPAARGAGVRRCIAGEQAMIGQRWDQRGRGGTPGGSRRCARAAARRAGARALRPVAEARRRTLQIRPPGGSCARGDRPHGRGARHGCAGSSPRSGGWSGCGPRACPGSGSRTGSASAAPRPGSAGRSPCSRSRPG